MAAPLQVQVIAKGSATPLVRAAEELRTALAADGRLAVHSDALGSGGAGPAAKDGNVAEAAALVAQARESYANLEPTIAMRQASRAMESLRVLLDREGVAAELAAALRVKGLTHLYMEKPKDAAQTFASAYFLDPEFSPGADQWPPEARLAYADAIAAVRRAPAGSLSVQVEPAVARVWVDGREVGVGPTTVRDLARGIHHVLVTCTGYDPFAAVVNVEGGGKLSQASVFLEKRSQAGVEAVVAFAQNFGGATETSTARQAAMVLGVDALVLVVDETASRRTVAWVLDAETGARRGASVPLLADDAQVAATEIAERLTGGEESPGVVAPADPWYLRWYTLAAAGVVVVGGAVALAVVLSQDSSTERVSFHLGDPP